MKNIALVAFLTAILGVGAVGVACGGSVPGMGAIPDPKAMAQAAAASALASASSQAATAANSAVSAQTSKVMDKIPGKP